jgi:hypothetical protein
VYSCQKKGAQELCGSAFTADEDFNNVRVIDPRGRNIRIQ